MGVTVMKHTAKFITNFLYSDPECKAILRLMSESTYYCLVCVLTINPTQSVINAVFKGEVYHFCVTNMTK